MPYVNHARQAPARRTHRLSTARSRRNGTIGALLLLAGVLSACTGSGSAPSAAADTEPGGAGSSAAGTQAAAGSADAVSVYPTPGSRTASPQTQISLRGIAADKIGQLSVTGSVSGAHPGSLRPDSDGHGASFVLARPLTPGETVTVGTTVPITGADSGHYTFTVSTPIAQPAGPGEEKGGDKAVQHFVSATALQPPTITVQAGKLTPAGGDFFLAPKAGPGQDGPMIVDSTGKLVWFDPLPNGLRAYDFTRQTYRGQPVLTWWQGYDTKLGTGIGVGEIYDDSYQHVATVKAGNGYHADLHDFTLTSDGTALVTAYQQVSWNTASAGGVRDGVALDSILQEIDIPTGNVLDEWHALDHVPMNESYAKANGSKPYDFFHINSIDKDADGNLLVSGRATHAVYQIDAATGDIVWRLGGKKSDFTGDGTVFNSQHDAKWMSANTLSLFDNGAGVGTHTEPRSRGMIIDLDPAARTATLAQDFVSPGVPTASSQGDTQPLPGGDVAVGWGAEPYVSEFAPDGSLLFQLRLPDKDASYRAYRFAWSGHPLSSPAASATAKGARTTVHVSWNGATQVRSWRVMTGNAPSSLSAGPTASRSGFETAITLAGAPRYLQVEALDQAGHVLGSSPAVTVPG